MVASALMVGGLWGRLAAVVTAGVLVAQYLTMELVAARILLPQRPVGATRLINAGWLSLAVVAGWLGGIPIWLATLLPESVADAASVGASALAVVIGLSVIEILKSFAVDTGAIESSISKRWRRYFEAAYIPLFEDGTLRETRLVNGLESPTQAYMAVTHPDFAGGYEHGHRIARANVLATQMGRRSGRTKVER